MQSADIEFYKTDAADVELLSRLIRSIRNEVLSIPVVVFIKISVPITRSKPLKPVIPHLAALFQNKMIG